MHVFGREQELWETPEFVLEGRWARDALEQKEWSCGGAEAKTIGQIPPFCALLRLHLGYGRGEAWVREWDLESDE